MDTVNIIGALIGYRLTSNATYVVSYHPVSLTRHFFESFGSFPKDKSSHIVRNYPLIDNIKMKDSSLSPVL